MLGMHDATDNANLYGGFFAVRTGELGKLRRYDKAGGNEVKDRSVRPTHFAYIAHKLIFFADRTRARNMVHAIICTALRVLGRFKAPSPPRQLALYWRDCRLRSACST